MYKKKRYIARIVAFIFAFTTIFANLSMGLVLADGSKFIGTINLNGQAADSNLKLDLIAPDGTQIKEFEFGDSTVTDSVYGAVYADMTSDGSTVSYSVYVSNVPNGLDNFIIHAKTNTHVAGVGPIDLGTPDDSYTDVSSVVYNVYNMESLSLLSVRPTIANVVPVATTLSANGIANTSVTVTVTDAVYGLSIPADYKIEVAADLGSTEYTGYSVTGEVYGKTDAEGKIYLSFIAGSTPGTANITVTDHVYGNTLGTGTITLIDGIAPVATVTSATVLGGAAVKTARSTETGWIYLVLPGTYENKTALDSQLGLAGTSVPVTTPNTNTTISAPASINNYKLYAVDAAGNVSEQPSTGTISVVQAPPKILFRDADIDQVYYQGETVSFAVYETSLPAIAEGENYAVQFGTGSYESFTLDTTLFTLETGEDYKNGVSVTDYVYFDTTVATAQPAMNGIMLRFGKVNGGTFTAFSSPFPVMSSFEKAIDESTKRNVFLNFDFVKFAELGMMPEGVTGTDLTTKNNLAAVSGLTFNREGFGTISFNQPINLLSDVAAQQLPALVQMDIDPAEIAIPSTALSFLAQYGATLTMTELPFDNFTNVIAQNDAGEQIPTTGLINGDIVFDSENRTLTFTVNHFTRYKATSKLTTPAKPTLSSKVAAWTGVANDNGGYSIQLYKDGTAFGDAATVTAGVYQKDFTASMSTAGSYTVKITVLGLGAFTISDPSVASDAQVVSSTTTGSTTTTTDPTDESSDSSTTEGAQKDISDLSKQSTVTAEQAATVANAATTITTSLTSSTATDSEKASSVSTAAGTVADLATIISKTTDTSAANTVVAKATEMIGAIAAAAASIKDENSANAVLTSISTALGNSVSLLSAVKDETQKQAVIEKTTEVIKATTLVIEKVTVAKAVETAESLIQNAAGIVKADKNEVSSEKIATQVAKLAEEVVKKVGKEMAVAQVDGNKATASISDEVASQIAKKAEEVLATAKNLESKLAENNIAGKVETKIVIEIAKQDGVTTVETTLPAALMETIKSKGIEKVEIAAGLASVSIVPDAIDTSDANSISLSVNKTDATTLTEAQKSIVGNNAVYDFDALIVKNSGEKEKVSSFSKAVEVRIPYEPLAGAEAEKVTVFFVNDNGELENKSGKYDPVTKTVVFTTEHFSKYVIKQNDVAFKDVPDTSWSKKYIEVLAAKGIAQGMADGAFVPNGNVTRAEFAAFLVRMFNLAEAKENITNKFQDTKTDAWYANAVMSAVEAGLVQGYNDGTFRPNEKISRQEMAVMAARAVKAFKGSKEAQDVNKYLDFSDKSKVKDYAKDSVALAVKYGIVNGKPGKVFDPEENATRAEAVKIIYMMYNM